MAGKSTASLVPKMTIPMLLIKSLILQFQDEKDNNENDEDEEEEDDGDVSICFFPEASILFFSKSCTSMDIYFFNSLLAAVILKELMKMKK